MAGLILPQKSSADSQSQPIQPNRNTSWQSINPPHADLSRHISKYGPEIWNVLSNETRTILVSLNAAELARLPMAIHWFHSCTRRIAWTGAFGVLYQKANKLGVPIFWELAGNSHIYVGGHPLQHGGLEIQSWMKASYILGALSSPTIKHNNTRRIR